MTALPIAWNIHKWVIAKSRHDGTWIIHPPALSEGPPSKLEHREATIFATGAEAIAAYADATTPTVVDTLTPACRGHVWRDSGACGDLWSYAGDGWTWRYNDGTTPTYRYTEDEVAKDFPEYTFTRIGRR